MSQPAAIHPAIVYEPDGYRTDGPKPMAPPQSCTTSVMRRRSSASMSWTRFATWSSSRYDQSSGLSDSPQPR